MEKKVAFHRKSSSLLTVSRKYTRLDKTKTAKPSRKREKVVDKETNLALEWQKVLTLRPLNSFGPSGSSFGQRKNSTLALHSITPLFASLLRLENGRMSERTTGRPPASTQGSPAAASPSHAYHPQPPRQTRCNCLLEPSELYAHVRRYRVNKMLHTHTL